MGTQLCRLLDLLILLVITVLVSTDLSPKENIERSAKCGQPNRYSLSAKPRTPFRSSPNLSYVLISPRHFLISSKYLKTFNKEKCLKSKKNAKFLLADVRKATFLGECQPEPNGFLLAEHEDPIGSTMFACLPNKPLVPGEEVKVKGERNNSNVKVASCTNAADNKMCLDTVVPDFTGPVYKENTVYGVAFGNSERQLEAWSLYEFLDEICDTSGICQEKSTSRIQKTSSKSPESRTAGICNGDLHCLYGEPINSSESFITLITLVLLIALLF